MDCEQIRAVLPAHVDRELGVTEAVAIEAHLQACPACRKAFMEQAALRERVRAQAHYFAAPHGLETRIRAALPRESGRERARSRWTWSWLNLAPTLAALVAVTWSVGLYMLQPSAQALLADDVVASHVRSLMSNRVADVASSDQHTVKPWFTGKLDYSPPVRDFTTQGFPLVGGRLDYVDRRPVAALVYRHRQHLINVYEWPAPGRERSAPQTLSRQGYHLVHWVDAGMTHWAISDLDLRELMGLVDILRNSG